MFTGIIQGMAKISSIIEKEDFRTHIIHLEDEWLTSLTTGSSVSHNGCCLTVTHIEGNQVAFDLMRETLRVTNLGQLRVGDSVNIERAARFGDEIGGHVLSGHILCLAHIIKIIDQPNNRCIWFELPEPYSKYIFTKGYIAIDGISLTIGDVCKNRFSVHLIPETLKRTNLGTCRVGSLVNIEIDASTQAIVETVERVLAQRLPV